MKLITQYKNIYMVGIKGVGMAPLAILLHELGASVTGSDIDEYFHTQDDLQQREISILTGFKKENITDSFDLVITTGAHGGLQNPEVVEAIRKNIPVLTHAEALGEVMKEFTNKIAVCGSHGKTTTSAFIAHMLSNFGLKPAAIIGSAHNTYYNFEKEFIVVEADEFGTAPPENKTPRFMHLMPDVIVCTNIDFDHPDIYSGIDETVSAFENFFKNESSKGMIIANGDDVYTQKALTNIPWQRYITFGQNETNNLIISDIKETESGMSFNARLKKDDKNEHYDIGLYGQHNVMNAGAVILTCIFYGQPIHKIKQALSTFTSTKRRMEEIFKINDTYLFDDYGHHPTEIHATLTAFKKRFPGQRLVVIFQPHTISRTKALEMDFVKSLDVADEVIITDIFLSARESQNAYDITSQDLLMNAHKNHFLYASQHDLIKVITSTIKQGDIIVTLGAGDLYKHHFDIISAIKQL